MGGYRAYHGLSNDEVLTKSGLPFMVKVIREIISMPRADSGQPIILWSIPRFSRMRSPNLMPKPTADIECLLLVGCSLSAWRVHVESTLGTLCQHAHTHIRFRLVVEVLQQENVFFGLPKLMTNTVHFSYFIQILCFINSVEKSL